MVGSNSSEFTAEEADFVVCVAVTPMVFDVKQPEETGLRLRGAIVGQHVGAWPVSQQKAQEFRLKTVGKFLEIIGLESKVFLDDSDDSIIETIVGSRCDLGEGNVAETGFARLEQAVRAAVTFAWVVINIEPEDMVESFDISVAFMSVTEEVE